MDFTEDFKKTSTFHLLSKQEIKVFSVYVFIYLFLNQINSKKRDESTPSCSISLAIFLQADQC